MTKLKVNTNKIVLSSNIRVFKTEQFIKKSKHLVSIDSLISFFADCIMLNLNKTIKNEVNQLDFFSITLDSSEILLQFCFKFAQNIQNTNCKLNCDDIIFFDIKNVDENRKNDSRIFDFLSKNNNFEILIEKNQDLILQKDFLKLYLLTNENGVNFPLLNEEQQALINIEDQNVLVQGVAGSGKTNICMNKLVFTALREYGGRVLYSTYSKSLLLDIKSKLEIFKQNVRTLNKNLKSNKVIFVDNDHIKAIENKLGGIWIDTINESEVTKKLDKMEEFLSSHIDLFLIEDLADKYKIKNSNEKMTNESYFVKNYVPAIKNYQLLSKFEKIKYLSYEIIYKEIYGNIFGSVNNPEKNKMLSLKEYKDLRKDSFSNFECETIYSIAQDYNLFLIKNNFVDNNILSSRLLSKKLEKYSLIILDEVQDFTQINLKLFKNISRRMFCVGDALQMINPSYFSFSLLKNLMFEENISNVKELTNNYRNSAKIEKIVENLNKINTKQFGVHSFVLSSKSIDNESSGQTFYFQSEDYIKIFENNKLSNLTFVCSTNEEKERLKKNLSNTEILTISEIKGLERNSIVLCDILSSNFEKWKTLERNSINRKTSDENSVYRYYFNLFYVGITRAKQNLYVFETKKIDLFKDLFIENFENPSKENLISNLNEENIINTITTEELLDRIDEFIKLMQFDNARFVASKLNENYEKTRQLTKISAYEECENDKDYRKLGITLWSNGFIEDAKNQFRLSQNYELIDLIDACQNGSSEGINGNIIEFLPLVSSNQVATLLIKETMKNELEMLKQKQQKINEKFFKIKGK